MDWTLVEAFGRRVRLGMVGGGADSVIGRTHLIAMRADGLCDLVAGAMSIDPEVARVSGRRELLAPDRVRRFEEDHLDPGRRAQRLEVEIRVGRRAVGLAEVAREGNAERCRHFRPFPLVLPLAAPVRMPSIPCRIATWSSQASPW